MKAGDGMEAHRQQKGKRNRLHIRSASRFIIFELVASHTTPSILIHRLYEIYKNIYKLYKPLYKLLQNHVQTVQTTDIRKDFNVLNLF